MVLGRVALTVLVVFAGAFVAGMIESFGMLAIGVDPTGAVGITAGTVAVVVIAALLTVPIYAAQLVGLVLTYAEQWAYEGPVSAGQLAAELR